MFTLKTARVLLASSGLAFLAACGGGGDEPPPPPSTASYTIGGSVAGLSGSGLVLQLNGANNLTVSANGSFTFPGSLTSGTAYAVTVSTQPTTPSQTCTVTSGTGTATANVTGVLVNCATSTFRVRGNVTGLTGSGLVLRNNGADNLAVNAAGPFTFNTAIPSGSNYEVTVFSQPSTPTQTCTVASGTGTITNADATGVAVTCTTNNYTVGGSVSGLVGSIVIRNTSGSTVNNITVTADGSFTFPAQASGSTYSVVVNSHPTGPAQTCTVMNGSGTVTTGNVSNIGISCSNVTYAVGGTISGLTGSGLVLSNGSTTVSRPAGSTSFTFPGIAEGSSYTIAVQTQPGNPAQTCSVTNPSGTVSGADVTNVAVSCVVNQFTVGGNVSGLTGSGLVLRKTSGGVTSDLPVSASGTFTFPAQADATPYAITVHTQPSSPTQSCSVTSGSGTLAGANVTNVAVSCTTTTFAVGGTVTGLAGTGLVLQNNAGDDKPISADGAFNFATEIASGANYSVIVSAQPTAPSQNCTVSNGSGTVAAAAITDVTVNCTTNQYVVSGAVNGYAGTGLVLRETIGLTTVDHPVSDGATSFAFAAQDDGTSYAISVLTQPNTPTQNCVVTSGSGSLSGANVSNVDVTCTTSQFTVGGTVTNLIGSGLVLQNNGAGNLAVSTGTFTFPAANSGTAYAVTVFTQPSSPAQTCSASNGSGTIGGANVTDVAITCVNDDQTAPNVSSTTPIDTTVGTNLSTTVVANFSEPLKPSSVTTSTFTLTGPGGTPVVGTVALSNGDQRATFTPNSALAFNTTYTATLTTGVQDPSGNALAANVVWTFNTGHKIAAGGYHTCARLAGAYNGKVKCWGSNSYGQLGQGTNTPLGVVGGEMGAALTEINLGSGRTAVDIEAGENFTCARLDNGTAKCWGLNSDGQLGQGDTTDRGGVPNEVALMAPISFVGGGSVLEVVAGTQHACARLSDGTVQCWGNNEGGKIGQDTPAAGNTRYLTPQVVNLGTGLRAVGLAAAGSYHTCAKLVNSTTNVYAGIKCWGDNEFGQLGQGDRLARGDNLNPMSSLGFIDLGTASPVVQVVATSGHTCALLGDNTVKCWGNNWFGQIGTGTANAGLACTPSTDECWGDESSEMGGFLPTVPLSGSVVEISGGDRQTCARFNDGTVRCWGWGEYGQLGLGDQLTRGDGSGEVAALPAIDLGTGFSAVEIAAGGFHECAVSSGGVVKCWGFNQTQIPPPGSSQGGQLGLGDTDNRGDGPNEMGDDLDPVDLTPSP